MLNRSLLSDFLPRSGRARARALPDRPHRAAAARGDARRRCAGGVDAEADARRGGLSFWLSASRETPARSAAATAGTRRPSRFAQTIRVRRNADPATPPRATPRSSRSNRPRQELAAIRPRFCVAMSAATASRVAAGSARSFDQRAGESDGAAERLPEFLLQRGAGDESAVARCDRADSAANRRSADLRRVRDSGRCGAGRQCMPREREHGVGHRDVEMTTLARSHRAAAAPAEYSSPPENFRPRCRRSAPAAPLVRPRPAQAPAVRCCRCS